MSPEADKQHAQVVGPSWSNGFLADSLGLGEVAIVVASVIGPSDHINKVVVKVAYGELALLDDPRGPDVARDRLHGPTTPAGREGHHLAGLTPRDNNRGAAPWKSSTTATSTSPPASPCPSTSSPWTTPPTPGARSGRTPGATLHPHLPALLDPAAVELVEAGVDGGRLSKAVVRFSAGAEDDLVLVIRPALPRWKVVTAGSIAATTATGP
jgi:hypothetical protein